MKLITRRWVPLTLLTIAIASLMFIGTAFVNKRSEASETAKPIAITASGVTINTAYNGASDDVGRLYVILSLSSQNDRRNLYSQFTAAQKRAVWMLHLTLLRLSINSPTPDQEAFFQKVGLILHRGNFDDLAKNAETIKEAKVLDEEATRLFGKAGARLIFNDLGGAMSLNSGASVKLIANNVNSATINTTYNGVGDDVGRLYVILSVSSRNDRRTLYSQFTPAQKRAVWTLHLFLLRLSINSPTPDQEAFFQKVGLVLYRGDFDDLTKNVSTIREAKSLDEEAVRLFGKDGAHLIFNDLGGAMSLNGTATVKLEKARLSFDGDCACNDYWTSYCGEGKHCKKGEDNCTVLNSGCGFLWWYPCNGLCVNNNPE